MRQVVGGVGAVLVQAMRTAVDLGGAVLDAQRFGAFGAPVAAAQQELQSHHLDALDVLLQGLQGVNGDVRRVADAYEDLDRLVAHGFDDGHDVGGGSATPTTTATANVGATGGAPAGGLLAGLWGSGVGTAVADHAVLDAGSGEPTSVGNVVGYLRDAGLGRVAATPLPQGDFDGPTSFADWLDSDPDHQTHVGVIHVYRGDVRDLADIPGGVRAGDVVVVDPDLIGVAATPGVADTPPALVNHGPVDPDLGHRASVRVYRPL